MSTSARHTGAPTSRAISVRSYGGVDAISHPFNHNSLNLSTAKAPKRISGMPPLHDVSRDWVKRPEAVTNCWPSLQRDYIGTDKHHELDPWASKYGAQHDEACSYHRTRRSSGSPSRTGIFTARKLTLWRPRLPYVYAPAAPPQATSIITRRRTLRQGSSPRPCSHRASPPRRPRRRSATRSPQPPQTHTPQSMDGPTARITGSMARRMSC